MPKNGNQIERVVNFMNTKRNVDCECNTAKEIKGIVCDVKSCLYHSVENKCCAGTISVGPHDAHSSSSTSCVTFKAKEC